MSDIEISLTFVERQENEASSGLLGANRISASYLLPRILMILQAEPRHPWTSRGLFPDGFPVEGSVYNPLAA